MYCNLNTQAESAETNTLDSKQIICNDCHQGTTHMRTQKPGLTYIGTGKTLLAVEREMDKQTIMHGNEKQEQLTKPKSKGTT